MVRQKAKRVYGQKSVVNVGGASAPKPTKPSAPPKPSLHRVIPAIVRRALAKKRMSEEELARECGLPLRLVKDILEGKAGKLHMRRLEAIADVLELDYADIVKRGALKDA